MTEWIIAISSGVTMLVAIGAFIIAKKAPKEAARFADEFRNNSVKAEEREKLRTQVLMALLRGRRQFVHQDTIAALNIVDFAFHDVPEVRSKYRVFVDESLGGNAERMLSAYHDLTIAAAKALGYAETMTDADMRLGYYPEILTKIDQGAIADAEEKLARRAAVDAAKQAEG